MPFLPNKIVGLWFVPLLWPKNDVKRPYFKSLPLNFQVEHPARVLARHPLLKAEGNQGCSRHDGAGHQLRGEDPVEDRSRGLQVIHQRHPDDA